MRQASRAITARNGAGSFPPKVSVRCANDTSANAHTGPAEQVILDRILSVSFIAALPPAEQAEVAGRIRALIAATPELAGKAEVAFPYDTAAFSCVRK